MSDIEAQGLAYALEMGAADLADARAWADSQIATAVSPRDELLALATDTTSLMRFPCYMY
jgi:hypothetical protein